MSDKKHIDRLFQEKLKDFEISPDKSVWKSIKADLNKKKKERRIIPLWWKLSGVAAGIILLIAIGSYFTNDTEPHSSETLVETPNNDTETNNNTETNLDILESEKEVSKTPTNNSLYKNPSLSPENNQNAIALSKNNTNISKPTQQHVKNNSASVNLNKSITHTKKNSQNSINSTTLQSEENKELIENNLNSSKNSLVQTDTENQEIKENEHILTDQNQNEISEAIVSNENEIKLNETPIKRWSINPNIAPIYFNSFGDGSTIHSQFINNSKSGKINMSFGINTSYALNNKLSVRTGVSKVDLGYSTNDVAVLNRTPSGLLNESLYKNIAFRSSGNSITFLNINQSFPQDFPTSLPNKLKGEIEQEIGFIEVPIELEYKLVDNKLGMSVIGGVSTLFLNDNKLYSVLDNEKTLIGEATNINKTSFSANFGVGVNYKITKKINLNLEPTLKYQLNTFNNTSGEVKPYFIGIYSGIKYKF